MKILIIGINYAPEPIGIGPYSTDMANFLAASGEQVSVVTANPYYPNWKVSAGFRSFGYSRRKADGVSIIHCPLYVPANPSGFRRIVHHLSFLFSAFFPVLFKALFDRPDVVMTIAPSLISAPLARMAGRIAGARTWIHVQDFEVEAAFATGLVASDSRTARAALAFQRWALKGFDVYSSISQQMCAKLAKLVAPSARVMEVRNWADMSMMEGETSDAAYRNEWGLAGKHVALYSGNVSRKQGIGIILDAAEVLKDRSDIVFVICGNGPEMQNLEKAAGHLPNIMLKPLQPREQLASLLKLASVHLLPQIEDAADLVLPSKLTNMLASGRPVVATALEGTGLANEAEGCGFVGSLYAEGDRRSDAGFTIFYMGINIGSIGSQTLCPLMVEWFGWWAGFLLVSAGMLVAYSLMQFGGKRLAGYGDPPPGVARNAAPIIYIAALLAVPVLWLVFHNVMNAPEAEPGSGFVGYLLALPALGKILFFTFLAAVIGIPIWSWRAGTRAEAKTMVAAIILIVFNVAFWTLVEQAGSSLTLFADRNTTGELWGIPISAGQTQNFNPITIVLFAPILSWLWGALARRKLEPPIPVKFGLALIGVGLGFLVLTWSGQFAGADSRVSLWWLLLSYFIQSVAELLISPVGLSMITQLSMARVVGMMMGVWFLSFSIAEYLAGAIAQSASVQTVGGQVTNARLSLDTYLSSFWSGGVWTIAIGILLLCLTPLIRRLIPRAI